MIPYYTKWEKLRKQGVQLCFTQKCKVQIQIFLRIYREVKNAAAHSIYRV